MHANDSMHQLCGFPPLALGILALVASCSGEPNAPTCGDGIQDPDEACDDGNRDSGDACTPACQIRGSVLECTTLFEGMGSDEVNALLPLPDLSFVIAGAKGTDGGQTGWIARYEDSGAQIWQTSPTEASSVIDIAADSSDGYWALVTRGADEELLHLDATGQIDTRLFLPDFVQLAGLSVSPARLLVADGHLWLAGRGAGADLDVAPDLWAGRFDIEAQVLDTILNEDYVGFDDHIWAIAGSESEVAVAATVDTSPSVDGDTFLTPHSTVLVIRFDLQGQEVGRHLLGAAEPGIAAVAYSIAADGNDGWVVGGDQHPMQGPLTTPQKAWVTRIHPSEGWMWTWASAGPPAGGLLVNDILVSDRELVAVGQAYGETGEQYWLMGLGLDGARHWEQNLGERDFLASEVTTVVLDDANRLRTTNRAWNWNGDNTTLQQSCLVAW
jgi:cysteine-rich repeat protein